MLVWHLPIWNTVDYGRNYGVLYDIGSWTDVLPEFW
ncbi:porin [Salmonella enterica subsp. enterica]|nr:porin [Salmonella enterica subsp. enterica]